MTEHQHSPAGGGEAMAPDTCVGAQIWTAARNLSEVQREQPEWLWHGANGPASFGRWGTEAYQAPYVRADIALGLNVLGPTPETIVQASLFTHSEILAALRIVRDAPPPQYGATPVERWTWDMGWVTRGDWRRGDGKHRLTAAGAAALLVGEMWAGVDPSVAAGDGGERPDERLPGGFEDRIISERHSIWPGMTVVGWLFSDRDVGLKAVAQVAAAALAAQRPAPAQAPETAGGAMFPIPPIAERDAELKTLRAQIDAHFSERGGATPPTGPDADDDDNRCFVCNAPILDGQPVHIDIEEGTVHAACCGPERASYVNLETGEPLKPGEPLPTPYAYRRDGRYGEVPTGLDAAGAAAASSPPAGADARREEIAAVRADLVALAACRRCSCPDCEREAAGELHDHVCTHGPRCVESAAAWRRWRFHAVRVARRAIPALAPAPSVPDGGWRPIETAPRDATVQIVVRPRGKPATYAVPTAPKTHPAYIDEQGRICCPGTWQPDLGLDGPHWQTVLWCPLAAPPVDLDRSSPPASGPAQSAEERS